MWFGMLQVITQVYPSREKRSTMQGHEREQLDMLLGGSQGLRDATPVFIVGMARSGSTLLEQMLASHSWGHGAGAAWAVPCSSCNFHMPCSLLSCAP